MKRNIIPYIVSLVGIFSVGYLDYLTGWHMSFSIFYLLPITYGTWYGNRVTGLVMALIGAIVWLVSDLVTASSNTHILIPYWNAFVRLGFFAFSSILLSRIKDQLLFEKQVARTDPLTGAYNARAFYELTSAELSRTRRHGFPLSIAYLDMDNFKTVNDTGGHETGDRLLSIVAKTAKRNVRESDLFARLGGDEFTILFPHTNQEQVHAAVEKIREQLSQEMEKERWPVTFSIGIMSFSKDFTGGAKEMIIAADRLMYEAKKNGKNRAIYKEYSLPDATAALGTRINN